ncbi:MAG: hypothetical protein V3V52_15355, partial [Candidatus Adiutricales bacterium]
TKALGQYADSMVLHDFIGFFYRKKVLVIFPHGHTLSLEGRGLLRDRSRRNQAVSTGNCIILRSTAVSCERMDRRPECFAQPQKNPLPASWELNNLYFIVPLSFVQIEIWFRA